MYYGLVKMVDRTEKEPKFRTAMFILIGCLALAYFSMKAWHIWLAFETFEGQELHQNTDGAAK